MRRLARHLFTLCSAVSLLFSVAVCVLWVQSHHYSSYVSYDAPDDSSAQAIVTSGRLYCEAITSDDYSEPAWGMEAEFRVGRDPFDDTLSAADHADMLERTEWFGEGYSFRGHGFKLACKTYRDEERLVRCRTVMLPCWVLAITTAVLPVWRLLSWRTSSRADRLGLCPSCGYDLRASPEECPECGIATATS